MRATGDHIQAMLWCEEVAGEFETEALVYPDRESELKAKGEGARAAADRIEEAGKEGTFETTEERLETAVKVAATRHRESKGQTVRVRKIREGYALGLEHALKILRQQVVEPPG